MYYYNIRRSFFNENKILLDSIKEELKKEIENMEKYI